MSEVPWREQAWTGPTQFASELVFSRDETTPLQIVSTGECPVCRHQTTDKQWLRVDVTGLVESADEEATLDTVEMRLERLRERGGDLPPLGEQIVQEMVCLCGAWHEDREGGARGCGAYWSLVLPVPAELR